MSSSLRRVISTKDSASAQEAEPRHFLDLKDHDPATLRRMLDIAAGFKGTRGVTSRPLAGKTLALIFEKPSTRTRVSFEVGMRQLGGEVIYMNARDMQSGRGESAADTARVLSRYVDAIVMRIMDGLMSIPPVLLAIALMALTRASVENVIAAITLAEVPRVVRLVRSLVLTLREQPYVEAAVAAGTTLPRILIRHILPNTLAPLLVQATYVCASAMITEAILSFIGAGTPPNIPSWGNIMAEARSLFQIAGYLILFPGIFLSLTVLAVNLLGDGMRDALDPRLARRM